MESQTAQVVAEFKLVLVGDGGVGKTTFATGADAPVVIMTEDGLGMLKVPHFPLATSYADVVEALDALLSKLAQRGRGGIVLEASVRDAQGQPVTTLSARYAAVASR